MLYYNKKLEVHVYFLEKEMLYKSKVWCIMWVWCENLFIHVKNDSITTYHAYNFNLLKKKWKILSYWLHRLSFYINFSGNFLLSKYSDKLSQSRLWEVLLAHQFFIIRNNCCSKVQNHLGTWIVARIYFERRLEVPKIY